jgi:hypothetical protein
LFPNHFAAQGSRSYPDYLAVTGDPRYPGYKTPIVTPEPSVERVVGAGRLTDGIIGTHIILWGPSWDYGAYGLHDQVSKSRGGAHRVAPEALSRLKSLVEG